MSIYSGIRGKGFLFISLLWFLWFFNFLSRLIFSPILPLIEDEFVISHAKASSLFAICSVGNAISLFASGIFTGFVGYKKSILISLGLSALVLFIIPHTTLFSHLAILLFVLGLAAGIYMPSVLAIITHNFHSSVWGKALSIHDTGASLSVVAAPLVAVFLLKFLAWRQFFYVFGVIDVFCAVAFFLSTEELKVERALKGYLGGILRKRSLWPLGIVWIFASGAFMALYFTIPLYLTKELGLNIGYANTIFSLSRLAGAAFVLLIAFVIDRLNLKKTLFTILFATGISVLFIGHSNILVMQVALFVQGSIVICFFPVGIVAVARMVDKEERSLATGCITTLATLFGAGLFPFLLGLSGDHLSFRFGIIIFGALVTLSSGLIYFVKGID